MRARGLKLDHTIAADTSSKSRPMRARGLKLKYAHLQVRQGFVAPHAGAWIETASVRLFATTTLSSRPMRARGLKPQDRKNLKRKRGRAPCGRVD